METSLLVIAAFITSSISAVIGMGGGIVLLAIMALIIPDGFMAVAMHGIIQLFSNATRVYAYRAHLNKIIILRFFKGASIGLLTSVFIILAIINFYDLKSANEIKVGFLKPIIGIFILWYLFLKKSNKNKQSHSFKVAGYISGIASVFIGASGPLIAPFFLNGKLYKESIVANKAAAQLISHTGKIPIFVLFFNITYIDQYLLLLPLILAVYGGTFFGKNLLNFIPENSFRRIFKICLTLIAIKLIIDSTISTFL